MASRTPTEQARRLTARGAATRERIVSSAADLMYVQGVGATSLEEVIQASGTGKSQLYHYFPDKDALVAAVVATWIERVMAFQEPLLREVASMRGFERWRDAVLTNNRATHGVHGCPLGSLAAELADQSEEARRALVGGFEGWAALFERGLRRMREAGELAPEAEPARLATALLAALQGGLLLAQTTRDPRALDIALTMALDHIRAHRRG
jgi:AcrR family transcriptional regulator